MSAFAIKRVVHDADASAYGLTRHILAQLPEVPVHPVRQDGSNEQPLTLASDKETLYLQTYKGDFLKPCPGTREYICCGYQILNLAANCPLDCSYLSLIHI